MEAYVNQVIEFIKTNMDALPFIVSMSLGIFIVFLESIIPMLPLCVFVALNVIIFGPVLGILLSYIGTVLGCLLSFYVFRKFLSDKIYKRITKKYKLKVLMDKVSDFNFSTLVLIMTFPFTPAFSINIASGLSKMESRRFILACLVAKLPMIYFWGYVGTTLIESLTNPYALINIVAILVVSYVASRIVRKKFQI